MRNKTKETQLWINILEEGVGFQGSKMQWVDSGHSDVCHSLTSAGFHAHPNSSVSNELSA